MRTFVSHECTDLSVRQTGGVGKHKVLSKTASMLPSLAWFSCSDDGFFCWNSSTLFLSLLCCLGCLRLYRKLSEGSVMWLNGRPRWANCCRSDHHDNIWVFLCDFRGIEQLLGEQSLQGRFQVCRQSHNWHGAISLEVLR